MSEYTRGDFQYETLENGSISITKYTGQDKELTLPSSLDGYPVSAIGFNAFAGNESLRELIIPEGVEAIKEQAFWLCNSLEEAILPKSLKTIDRAAFYRCTTLRELYIPASVKSIADDAFNGCAYLVIHADPGSWAWSFARRKGIPSETITCGDFDFAVNVDGSIRLRRYLGNAQKVCLPAQANGRKLVSIGEKAFFQNKDIRHVVIPEGVEHIYSYSFFDCNKLETLVIPSSVKQIDAGALDCCKSLANIQVSAENPCFFAEDGALYESQTATLNAWPSARGSICVREGTRCIGPKVFTRCSNLTEVSIPESVDIIGSYAFNWCWNITRLKLPESMELISYFAFNECRGLEEIVLPASLGTLYSAAFANCSNLKELHLPQKLAELQLCVFEDLHLDLLYIHDPDTQIMDDGFSGSLLCGTTIFAHPDSQAA